MSNHRNIRAALALALLAVLGAGCGEPPDDDRSGPEASDRPRSDDATTTTTTVLDPEAERAAAEAVLLTQEDLPDWGTGLFIGAAPVGRPERFGELGTCLGSPLIDDGYAVAHSPTYNHVEEGDVAATVIVTPTVADAQRLMEVVRTPDVPRCYADSVRNEVAQAGPHPIFPEAVAGEPLAEARDFEQFGDDTAALQVTLPWTLDGEPFVPFYYDIAYVQVGRVVIVTSYASTLESDPEPDVPRYVIGRMIDRVPPTAASDEAAD